MELGNKPLFYIIVGESSGDLLGASLIKALQEKLGKDNCSFMGIGGPKMQEHGFKSIFDYSELSVMGITEVVPSIFNIKKRIKETVSSIKEVQPTAFISIDSPGFTFRVAKRLKKQNFPLIHYVAPSVWAWKPQRAKAYANIYDYMLCLFPFEPPYFDKVQLPSTFVGHPITNKKFSIDENFNKQFNLAENDKLVLILPGSRKNEIEKLLPIFIKSAQNIKYRVPEAKFIIISLEHTQSLINKIIGSKSEDFIVVDNIKFGSSAIARANAAIATSGTISLELARAGVPHNVSYKVNSLSYAIAKLIYRPKSQYINLINILCNEFTISEFIQKNCNSQAITENTLNLLLEDRVINNHRQKYTKAMRILNVDNNINNDIVARTVLNVIKWFKNN